eukprot:928642-Pyramimonas_sp.AAC.1
MPPSPLKKPPRGRTMASRWPKTAQDASKTAQEAMCLFSAFRWPNNYGPRGPQDCPRGLKYGLATALEAPQAAPRWRQDGPRPRRPI